MRYIHLLDIRLIWQDRKGRRIEFLFHQQNKNPEHTSEEIKFIPKSMLDVFNIIRMTGSILNIQLAVILCFHHLIQYTRCLISCPQGEFTDEDVQSIDISLHEIVEYLDSIGQEDYSQAIKEIQLYITTEDEEGNNSGYRELNKRLYIDWQNFIFDVYIEKIRPTINIFDVKDMISNNVCIELSDESIK